MKKYICEFIGTLMLVLFGCGVAVLTESEVFTTALAFGLSIVVIYYSIGSISGCHLNPAVSFAMFVNGKIKGSEFIKYTIAQILGAIAGALLLALLLNNISSIGDFKETNMGVNSFGGFGVNMFGAFVAETILTFIFILTVLGITNDKKVEGKKVSATLNVYFVDENNEAISDKKLLIANKITDNLQERTIDMRFLLKNQEYDRNKRYYLTIENSETGVVLEQIQFVIDIVKFKMF